MLALGIVLAGGIGAAARVVVQRFAARRVPGGTPVGTLAVNVGGALLLGLLVGADVHGDALTLAGVGLLGSYTTFSGWLLESKHLELRRGTANVTLSLALGLAAVALGRVLGGAL
jgi:fluoride exporter